MRPLRVLVTLTVALLAGGLLLRAWRSRSETSEARLERAQLKREFLERGSVARELAGERAKEWRDEVRALARWYFDEIAALHARHPGEKPRPLAPESPGKGKEAEATQADWRRYAEERFQMLRDGRYEPLYSAGEHGLHLDLLSLEPAPNPAGGERALRIDFALWGPPRRVEKETNPTGKTTARVAVPLALRQIAFQFLDDQGKVYGEMNGPGEPYQKIADPERFVEDFPPGVLFGTWYVDLFPHQAARALMTLSVEVRGQAGADLAATFKLDLPVRDEWRLPAGEVYKAETREAAP
jgi:hypothetical protein